MAKEKRLVFSGLCALGTFLLLRSNLLMLPSAYETEDRSTSDETSKSMNSPLPPSIPKKIPTPLTLKKPIFAASLSSPHSSYSEKPEGNIIEFKVVNGQAIAFGDVILGKPEASFQGNRGRYEAPGPGTWPTIEIPYHISPELPNPQRVEKALDYFRRNTPVKFIPHEGQADAIIFEPGTELCYSYLGRIGGLQPIQLSSECQTQEILHEIMHALGFIHEQSRPDRNLFISINWDNIDEKYQAQFAMASDAWFEPERTSPFDYHSVMLYSPHMFAKQPDQPAMRTVGSEEISPIQEGLSEGDIRRVREAFRL